MNRSFKTYILVIITVICCANSITSLNAQRENSLVSKRNAISFSIAGASPFIGLSYERLVSDKINLEVGLGAISLGIGMNYYPWRIQDNKMVFHTGFGTTLFSTPLDTFGSGDFWSISYIKIGLSYFGKEGFNFAIDIGPSLNYDITFEEVSNPIYGNLKLGYRF